MTTMEVNSGGFEYSRSEWLDSVPVSLARRERVSSRFKSWLKDTVYGVEAPRESTYTRFEGQQSQVAFADSIPANNQQVTVVDDFSHYPADVFATLVRASSNGDPNTFSDYELQTVLGRHHPNYDPTRGSN